jgi:hypothetical protein
MTTLKRDPNTRDYVRCKFNARQGFLTCHTHREFEEVIGDHDQTFFEDIPDDCPICCEEINKKSDPLTCGHWIHRTCVVKSGKAECPLCRSRVYLTYPEMSELIENSLLHRPDQIDDIPDEDDNWNEELEEIYQLVGQISQRLVSGELDPMTLLGVLMMSNMADAPNT